MLWFTVSQATVSRYMPARSRRPTQSWRTFLHNQAGAFGQYSEQRSKECAPQHNGSYWVKVMQFTAAQTALGRQQAALNAGRISLRFAQRDRGVTLGTRRVAAVPAVSSRALGDRGGAALRIRSPPHQVAVRIAARLIETDQFDRNLHTRSNSDSDRIFGKDRSGTGTRDERENAPRLVYDQFEV